MNGLSLLKNLGINWWITSALESNIGLNTICQYTYTKKNPLPQGLGTGALFTNNFETHLQLEGDQMWHKKNALLLRRSFFQRLNLCFQNVFS